MATAPRALFFEAALGRASTERGTLEAVSHRNAPGPKSNPDLVRTVSESARETVRGDEEHDGFDPEVESTIVTEAPAVKPELLPKGLANRLAPGDEVVSAAELLRRKGVDSEQIRAARNVNTGASWSPPKPTSRPKADVRPAAPPTPQIPRAWIAIAVVVLLVIVGAAVFAGFVLGRGR